MALMYFCCNHTLNASDFCVHLPHFCFFRLKAGSPILVFKRTFYHHTPSWTDWLPFPTVCFCLTIPFLLNPSSSSTQFILMGMRKVITSSRSRSLPRGVSQLYYIQPDRSAVSIYNGCYSIKSRLEPCACMCAYAHTHLYVFFRVAN